MNETESNFYPYPSCAICPHRVAQSLARAGAQNCPVMQAMGKWGWPCHETLADIESEAA